LVKEYIADSNTQRLTILPNEELKIVITIPHDVFAWYVDVFDRTDTKIHTNWLDHYGETDAKLTSEMKASVEGFIVAVTKHPLRLIEDGKPGQSILQVYRNDEWTDRIY
jgi:hypothetical protein